MKSRFINYDDWLNSIILAYPLLSSKCWVAGGAVRNLVEGFTSPQQDLDLYFSSAKDLLDAETWLTSHNWVANTESNYALTYENSKFKFKIQLIHTLYDNIQSCLDSFDYTAAQCAFDGTDLHFGSVWTLHDIVNRRLVLHKFQHPIRTVQRLVKYVQYGYKPVPETYVGIADGISGVKVESF